MRAVWRLSGAVLAVGLALAPAPLLAQDAAATTAEPPSDVVGPRELQNFSLNGTVTRPAETVAAPRSTAPAAAARSSAAAGENPESATAAPRPSAPSANRGQPVRAPVQTAQAASRPAVPAVATPPPSNSPSVAVPPPGITPAGGGAAADAVAAAPGFSNEPESLAGEHRLLLWPWLLAALILAGGAALFWRNRSREAFAGGPQVDAFVAPEPAAAPPKAPPGIPAGIVSTRMRPWIEVVFEPQRFVVDEQQVAIEFELRLQNSGNAPARGVLVEASMFNAGRDQDREIGAFFQSPVGEGERIAIINPLKSVAMRTRVAVPRESVQLYEVGGRQLFVPLIAFNALYSWSGGEGQTSNSFLLGRDTKAEKMAPFRLDLGPRIFRGVGAHPLPEGVRV